eukprot:1019475-Pelagomonas_calceolata.AAC.2
MGGHKAAGFRALRPSKILGPLFRAHKAVHDAAYSSVTHVCRTSCISDAHRHKMLRILMPAG